MNGTNFYIIYDGSLPITHLKQADRAFIFCLPHLHSQLRKEPLFVSGAPKHLVKVSKVEKHNLFGAMLVEMGRESVFHPHQKVKCFPETDLTLAGGNYVKKASAKILGEGN